MYKTAAADEEEAAAVVVLLVAFDDDGKAVDEELRDEDKDEDEDEEWSPWRRKALTVCFQALLLSVYETLADSTCVR